MKKFNYNIILFVAAALIIAAGWCSSTFPTGIKNAVVNFANSGSVTGFIEEIDDLSQNVWYKNTLIDVNSLFCRTINTRVVEKDNATVVKLDNDYLSFVPAAVSQEQMTVSADKCARLQQELTDAGIDYLYVAAPSKAYFGGVPADADSGTKENFDTFIQMLAERNVNVLNLAENMSQQGMTMENSFFITDHHWLPQTGLWAAGEICSELAEKHGLSFNPDILDSSYYHATVYEDYFLGSVGKKVGQYFTVLGLDDISLITPSFNTDLTITDYRGTVAGSFEETVIASSFLQSDDLYTANPYCAYSGGDFPLQVIENHLADEGAGTILVIRDSYSCVVTPFLSLAADSVHIIDPRYWEGVEGAETVSEYIELISPDHVIVINSGVPVSIFDFE